MTPPLPDPLPSRIIGPYIAIGYVPAVPLRVPRRLRCANNGQQEPFHSALPAWSSPSASLLASRPRPPVPPRRTAAPTTASCATTRSPGAAVARSRAPVKGTNDGRAHCRRPRPRLRRAGAVEGAAGAAGAAEGRSAAHRHRAWRGRARQRTGPAKWVCKKCEHGRRKDMCKDCGGASICQRGDASGVLFVYHRVRPLQVALCMHIYTHTHDISQCKRTTPKTHTCCPPPNMLPPYRAPSLSLIPSLCLLSLSEAREKRGREGESLH